jgi:hypothetical protein
MNLKDRISLFSSLGEQINLDSEVYFGDDFNDARIKNPWFTKSNIDVAISSIKKLLSVNNIHNLLSNYNIASIDEKRVLVIMAGNIPLVGFSDLFCVLISGNKVLVKFSSKDDVLIKFLLDKMIGIDSRINNYIEVVKNVVKSNFDAVIATGSDSSSKYFNYYFDRYKKIIRKNRRSIAILDGTEADHELELLSDDIFMYFGLGCRSVSKLFLPPKYNLDKLFNAFYRYKDVINHLKYSNNYNYNKTIYLMNNEKIFDNGFILLKEDVSIQSPISTLFYEFYNDRKVLDKYVESNKSLFQCIVSKDNVPFGESQFPKLNDYADKIDTINFLINL